MLYFNFKFNAQIGYSKNFRFKTDKAELYVWLQKLILILLKNEKESWMEPMAFLLLNLKSIQSLH